MTEQHQDQIQLKKKRGKLTGIISLIAILCVIVLGAKFLGRQVGRKAAMQTVQQESITQNAPTGFMGAKWLVSISQVKSLFPDATEFAPGNLKLNTTAFGRSAFVDFMFTDNLLLMIIITFKGEKTESTYRKTHFSIEREYGPFPEPSSTNEHILASKKTIGRIAIHHLLYKQLGMTIEQVMLYRTKGTTQQHTTPARSNAAPVATGQSAVGSSLPARRSRFALIKLPLGIIIEVPKNWRLLDGDFNTTIETAGEAVLNLAGIKLPTGQKVNLFRANSNPPTTYAGIAINATDSDIPPAELLSASDAEIRELAPLMHQMLDQGFAAQNLSVIRFDGVRRETVDGHPALVIEFVRSGPQGPVVVQMTRLFIGDKEMSLNLSYRQSEAGVWKPIVDHMRSTFRVSRP